MLCGNSQNSVTRSLQRWSNLSEQKASVWPSELSKLAPLTACLPAARIRHAHRLVGRPVRTVCCREYVEDLGQVMPRDIPTRDGTFRRADARATVGKAVNASAAARGAPQHHHAASSGVCSRAEWTMSGRAW
jgi:hypothetical protein